MNLGDFNDIMRKDRSGFRPPNSKDMGATDSGPYFEKVSWILCLIIIHENHFGSYISFDDWLEEKTELLN